MSSWDPMSSNLKLYFCCCSCRWGCYSKFWIDFVWVKLETETHFGMFSSNGCEQVYHHPGSLSQASLNEIPLSHLFIAAKQTNRNTHWWYHWGESFVPTSELNLWKMKAHRSMLSFGRRFRSTSEVTDYFHGRLKCFRQIVIFSLFLCLVVILRV